MPKLLVLLALPLGLLAMVASLGVVVVDVRESGPDGNRLIVPVPLLAVQLAAACVPAHPAHLELGAATRYLPAAREVLEALAEAPDGELVRVEEGGGERVLVAKEGDRLRVHVRDGDEEVLVNVPFRLALEIIPRDGGAIAPSEVVGGLWSARFTQLVEVRDGRDHVRVSVW